MLLKLAWRNLWRNKLRTSTMLGAMAFGLVGVILMMGFMSGLVANMISNAIAWQTSHIQLHSATYLERSEIQFRLPINEQGLVQIAQHEFILAVAARKIVHGMLASARSNRTVTIRGIDPDSEKHITPLASQLQAGEWFNQTGRNPILVSESLAQKLGLILNSKVVITFTKDGGEVTGAAFKVLGIYATPSAQFDDNNVLVRYTDLYKLTQNHGFHEVAILLKDTQQIEPMIGWLKSQVGADVIVRSWKQVQPLLSAMLSTMDTSNQIMLVIFVIAMTLGIINVMLMSVYERTQEFGVLMAVGMSKKSISVMVLFESVLLSALGALLGLTVSATLVLALNMNGIPLGAFSEGLAAYGVDTVIYPQVSYLEYQVVFLTMIIASVIAAIFPTSHILRKSPADAMMERN